MDILTTFLTIGLAVVLTALLGVAVASAWRRVMTDDGRLRLWEAMRRRGLAAEDATGHERSLATAARRCTMCSSPDECQHWLETRSDAPGDFCPNTTFMENLAREKRGVTAKR